nr:LysR substrate-binding domain-containing protein [Acinetobacter baumannii]
MYRLEEVTFSSGIMANDAEAMVACALNHIGLMQVPGILVMDELHNGTLVQVLQDLGHVNFPLSIMYPNRQYLAPQVRTFIDWVIETIQSKTGSWIQ